VLAAFIFALMMEAASTPETSVNFYQTTLRNNPEDSNLHKTVLRNPCPSAYFTSKILKEFWLNLVLKF
jgi:hypothetical protein